MKSAMLILFLIGLIALIVLLIELTEVDKPKEIKIVSGWITKDTLFIKTDKIEKYVRVKNN